MLNLEHVFPARRTHALRIVANRKGFHLFFDPSPTEDELGKPGELSICSEFLAIAVIDGLKRIRDHAASEAFALPSGHLYQILPFDAYEEDEYVVFRYRHRKEVYTAAIDRFELASLIKDMQEYHCLPVS
jgi:hypothetical protein